MAFVQATLVNGGKLLFSSDAVESIRESCEIIDDKKYCVMTMDSGDSFQLDHTFQELGDFFQLDHTFQELCDTFK